MALFCCLFSLVEAQMLAPTSSVQSAAECNSIPGDLSEPIAHHNSGILHKCTHHNNTLLTLASGMKRQLKLLFVVDRNNSMNDTSNTLYVGVKPPLSNLRNLPDSERFLIAMKLCINFGQCIQVHVCVDCIDMS